MRCYGVGTLPIASSSARPGGTRAGLFRTPRVRSPQAAGACRAAPVPGPLPRPGKTAGTRGLRIPSVGLEEVDVIAVKTTQAGIDPGHDVLAGQPRLIGAGTHPPVTFVAITISHQPLAARGRQRLVMAGGMRGRSRHSAGYLTSTCTRPGASGACCTRGAGRPRRAWPARPGSPPARWRPALAAPRPAPPAPARHTAGPVRAKTVHSAAAGVQRHIGKLRPAGHDQAGIGNTARCQRPS
jgi:hypothetical protein